MTTALTDLQRRVAEVYENGEYGHIQSVEEAKECGDSLFVFLVLEAGDAGDSEEFIGMVSRVGEQLSDMKDAMGLKVAASI